MEYLLIPFFKLQEHEADYIKAKKRPWWHFGQNNASLLSGLLDNHGK